jgi:phosphoribosylanthranilate isomerase
MKIKICGLSRLSDVDAVNEIQPDYAGFVFAQSTREVTMEQAAQLRAALSATIIPVGVFVDASVEMITQLYDSGIISSAQLHGSEDAAYIDVLKIRTGITVIKAVKLSPVKQLISLGDLAANYPQADFMLFDAGQGSGTAFDWKLLDSIPSDIKYFLAGGIHQNNIMQAIMHKPFCVDVSSGAETNGVKDKEKIRALVHAVRAA